jgi:P27 family predicted phage terminase small subunit
VKAAKAAVRSTRKPAQAAAPTPEAAVETKLRAPAWLKGEGLEVWDRWAPRLRKARLLGVTDELAFARYCRNFAKWQQIRSRLDRRGYSYLAETVGGGKLRRIDPEFMVADRLERQLMAAEDRFGMNPAERQRIMAARANAPAGDLFGDEPARRDEDPAAEPAQAAEPIEDPIGVLH